MAVGQQVLRGTLDVPGMLAVEDRLERRAVDAGRTHAGLLRDVLELHTRHLAAGMPLSTVPQVALLLRCSEWRAGRLLNEALGLAELPQGLESLEWGLLTPEQSWVVVTQLAPLTPGTRAAVWQRLLDRLPEGALPPARLTELLKRWVVAADTEAAERRRKAGEDERRVAYRRREDGLVDLFAMGFRGPVARAILSRIQDRSAPYGSLDDRTADQRRFDALQDMLLGRDPQGSCGCPAGDVAPCGADVQVLIPLGAALGRTDEVAEVVGHGPIEPDLAEDLLSNGARLTPVYTDADGVPVVVGRAFQVPRRADPGRLREVLLSLAAQPPPDVLQPRHPYDHPEPRRRLTALTLAPAAAGGHPPDQPGPYRVTGGLRRLLFARAPRCEFPGCGARAVRCDAEHDLAWPTGPTCACNLRSEPADVFRSYAWTDDEGWSYKAVVCMTMATQDGDDDGLPDDVDLEPVTAGTAEDLGAAAQFPSTTIGGNYGGPTSKAGLPACPALVTERTAMVALGDSFSSGEGAYAYQAGTDIRGENHCHRSGVAYPRVAFRALSDGSPNQEIRSLACSGAVTKHLLSEPFCGTGCDEEGTSSTWQLERSQISALRAFAASPGVTVPLVTVGIGGNDAGFREVVKKCITPGAGNCVAALDRSLLTGRLPHGAKAIPDVALDVAEVLEQVKQATEADAAQIVLVGYPVFISRAYRDCPSVAPPGIGSDEAEWMRGQILEMNRALARVAADAGPRVRYLSLDNVYNDNVLCNGQGPDTQWVHGVILQTAGSETTPPSCNQWVTGDHVKPNICHESFHPKAEGHQATGLALAACVRDGQCGSPSNETVRPATNLDNDDSVIVASAPTTTPAGRSRVAARAEGFQPGTPVQFDLHSDPVALATVTADADGVARLDVDLPADTPPGAHHVVAVGPGTTSILRVARSPITVSCTSASTAQQCADSDVDDVPAMDDNCPGAANADQADREGDGVGDVCDEVDDLADTDALFGFVRALRASGITLGCSAPTPDVLLYCPQGNVDRSQMAIFLARGLHGSDNIPTTGTVPGKGAYDCREGGTSVFTDVAPDSTLCRYVHKIAAAGVTLGNSPTTYGTTGNVLRDSMAVFVARAVAGGESSVPDTATISGGPAPDGNSTGTARSYDCRPGGTVHFTDVPVGHSACKHVHYLWAKGIISGTSATTYGPSGNVSRLHMAKFLTNAFHLQIPA